MFFATILIAILMGTILKTLRRLPRLFPGDDGGADTFESVHAGSSVKSGSQGSAYENAKITYGVPAFRSSTRSLTRFPSWHSKSKKTENEDIEAGK